MTTNLYKVHSASNISLDNLRKGLLLGALLFFLIQPAFSKTIKLAILDTGFCPDLLKAVDNVTILQVSDLTQSVTYKCKEGQLKSRRFHGHWVLSEILNNLGKPEAKLEIYPMVIFNKNGEQYLRYWKRAFKEANKQSVDLIVAAAGLPLSNNDLRQEASKIQLPSSPILLAAGRLSPGVPKDALLFPHSLLGTKQKLTFGSYHKGVDDKGPHFKDTSLIGESEIDFYFPFNFKPRLFGELKGTSLSLALGVRSILTHCPQALGPNKSLSQCLNNVPKKTVTLKNKDQNQVVKELLFQGD